MSTSFKFWARALRKFSPAKPKERAQYGKLVLVVVLVLQSEGRYKLEWNDGVLKLEIVDT